MVKDTGELGCKEMITVCSPEGVKQKVWDSGWKESGVQFTSYIWVGERKVIFLHWPKVSSPVPPWGFLDDYADSQFPFPLPADITCSDSPFCSADVLFFVVPNFVFVFWWMSIWNSKMMLWRGLQVFPRCCRDIIFCWVLWNFSWCFFFGLDWCWSKRFHVDDCSSRWLSCPW